MPKTGQKTRRNARAVMGKTKKVKITTTVPVKPMKLGQKAQLLTLVKKMINKSSETKRVGWVPFDHVSFNGAVNTLSDIYQVIGSMSEGTDYNQRIGDKIRPRSLTVKVMVGLNPLGGTITKDIRVRCMIGSFKSIKTNGQLALTAPFGQLLDYGGSAGPQMYLGDQVSALAPMNPNVVRSYGDKSCLLTQGTNEQETKNSHVFTFKVPVPATLHYDDSTSAFPNNWAPFICLGYAHTDGSSADYPAPTRVNATCLVTMTYEDA